MSAATIILVVFLSCLFVSLSMIGIIAFYLKAVQKRRLKENTLQNRMDIGDLFMALEFILKTEMDLYEMILRNTSDVDLTTIDNSEFINIYQDLSRTCLKSVSPQFWELIEVYMDREAAQTYITQRVYNYLSDKVRG